MSASRDGKRTRQRILEAAETIFLRDGYQAARVEQIARAAGVKKANIYYYFDGKEALYQALLERILMNVVSEIGEFLHRDSSDTWERLDHFLDLFFLLAERYQGLIGLALGALLNPPARGDADESPIQQLVDGVYDAGKALIAEGIAAGTFRDQDPGQVVMSLQGALLFYFMLPEARREQLVGAPETEAQALAERRQHLRDHMRRMLEP